MNMDANAVRARLNEFRKTLLAYRPGWHVLADKVVIRFKCEDGNCLDALKRASAHGIPVSLVKSTFPMGHFSFLENSKSFSKTQYVVLQLPENEVWEQLNNAGFFIYDIFPVVTIDGARAEECYFLPDFLAVTFSESQVVDHQEFGGCKVVSKDALSERFIVYCPASASKNVVELMHDLRHSKELQKESVHLIRLEFDILC